MALKSSHDVDQPMFTVFIRGIEFYGFHGVPAEERVVGHRYRVDVELQVAGNADRSDHISETVDYGALAVQITEIGTIQQVQTVERLARIMGEDILSSQPQVTALKISVAKPNPPAPVIADIAGVELVLTRED